LYRFSGIEPHEIADLDLEFRNGESARFDGHDVVLAPENPYEGLKGSSSSDKGYDEACRQLSQLERRIQFLANQSTSDGQAVVEDKNRLLSEFKVPEDFLFYILDWPSPHLGLEVCVRWAKPVKENKSD